jgi:hypothetical protein
LADSLPPSHSLVCFLPLSPLLLDHLSAPPTNQSLTLQWTVGAVYYSALVAAEVFGQTGTAQIIDLQGNDGNEFTPQYAIYENGNLDKVALFNYVTDPSGANTYTATIQLNGGKVPSQVKVK